MERFKIDDKVRVNDRLHGRHGKIGTVIGHHTIPMNTTVVQFVNGDMVGIHNDSLDLVVTPRPKDPEQEGFDFYEEFGGQYSANCNPYVNENKDDMIAWFMGYFSAMDKEVRRQKSFAEELTMEKEEPCDCGCMDPVFTTAIDALKFLSGRFGYAGVGPAVASAYKRDIDAILKKIEESDGKEGFF